MEAYGQEGLQVPCCLAVSGSKLISGSVDRDKADEAQQYEVRVWDLGTLECKHTLLQPAGSDVWYLTAGCGMVWGGVGKEAVVWALWVGRGGGWCAVGCGWSNGFVAPVDGHFEASAGRRRSVRRCAAW